LKELITVQGRGFGGSAQWVGQSMYIYTGKLEVQNIRGFSNVWLKTS
jgi:hypothetical protein